MSAELIFKQVRELPPGKSITFDANFVDLYIRGYSHKGAYFTPADRVLGNIIGSAYTHSYDINRFDNTVTFHRFIEEVPHGKGYVAPDRRSRG